MSSVNNERLADIELVEVIVSEQHVEDVKMRHRARNRLTRGQEPASPRDRVWKKHDNFALEPFGQPIVLMMLDGVPDG